MDYGIRRLSDEQQKHVKLNDAYNMGMVMDATGIMRRPDGREWAPFSRVSDACALAAKADAQIWLKPFAKPEQRYTHDNDILCYFTRTWRRLGRNEHMRVITKSHSQLRVLATAHALVAPEVEFSNFVTEMVLLSIDALNYETPRLSAATDEQQKHVKLNDAYNMGMTLGVDGVMLHRDGTTWAPFQNIQHAAELCLQAGVTLMTTRSSWPSLLLSTCAYSMEKNIERSKTFTVDPNTHEMRMPELAQFATETVLLWTDILVEGVAA